MFGINAGKSGEKCFTENRNLFGNSKSDPEKFNLYAGLALLASAVTEQSQRIAVLERKLDKAIKLLNEQR